MARAIGLLLEAGLGAREIGDRLDIPEDRVRAMMRAGGLAGSDRARKFPKVREPEVVLWDSYRVTPPYDRRAGASA
jgi:hypothetical protein